MRKLSRRSFLAATAAMAAPAFTGRSVAAEGEVVIVGAGAAGIAAARRLAAANRPFRIFEASERIGGRCTTDGKIFGVPVDLGAHWIHSPDSNPAIAAAANSGFDIYPTSRALTVRVGSRKAGDSELEGFLATTLKTSRALADLGKLKTDVPASRLLPKDLGDWQATMEFMYGPLARGKELKEISAFELVKTGVRSDDAYCRQGYGALLAKLSASLNVTTGTPVDAIYWGINLAVDTPKGNLIARAAIVTVSPEVLSTEGIEFIPPLPKRQFDAAQKLTLGSYERIIFDMPGNPLDLQRDDMVFEQTNGTRTAALLGNVGGSSLHMVDIAGPLARELSGKGGDAIVDFGREWLTSVFGSNVKNAIKKSYATNWTADPLVRGAMFAPGPGSADARKILAEPLGGKVWFAGEAMHETQWGTVTGAWESGTRAAEAVLRSMGVRDSGGERPSRRKRRRGDDD